LGDFSSKKRRLWLALVIWAWALAAFGLAAGFVPLPASEWGVLLGGSSASKSLVEGEIIGQSLKPHRSLINDLGLKFGTHLGRASGRVEVLLLKGSQTPLNAQDITRRTLARQTIEAGRLTDNAFWRWPGLEVRFRLKQGLYLALRPKRTALFRPAPLKATWPSAWATTGRRTF